MLRVYLIAQNSACQVNCLCLFFFFPNTWKTLWFSWQGSKATCTRENATPSPCFIFVDSQFSPREKPHSLLYKQTDAGFREDSAPATSFPALHLAQYRRILATSRQVAHALKAELYEMITRSVMCSSSYSSSSTPVGWQAGGCSFSASWLLWRQVCKFDWHWQGGNGTYHLIKLVCANVAPCVVYAPFASSRLSPAKGQTENRDRRRRGVDCASAGSIRQANRASGPR